MRFEWSRWFEGAAFAVALAALPVVVAALADHHVTPAEWSILGTTCGGAFLAYLRQHRPPIEALPQVPPELAQVWEEHKAEAEKAALAAILAALSPTTGAK